MNEALRELAVECGAPEEVLNQLWFSIFLQTFTHKIIEMAEIECSQP
jgi:hypothetical protein